MQRNCARRREPERDSAQAEPQAHGDNNAEAHPRHGRDSEAVAGVHESDVSGDVSGESRKNCRPGVDEAPGRLILVGSYRHNSSLNFDLRF